MSFESMSFELRYCTDTTGQITLPTAEKREIPFQAARETFIANRCPLSERYLETIYQK